MFVLSSPAVIVRLSCIRLVIHYHSAGDNSPAILIDNDYECNHNALRGRLLSLNESFALHQKKPPFRAAFRKEKRH